MSERRRALRETLALRVALAHGLQAVTRNLGPGGLYLVLPAGHAVDDWIRLELTDGPARLRLRAWGEVRRVERLPEGVGVALALHRLRLSRLR